MADFDLRPVSEFFSEFCSVDVIYDRLMNLESVFLDFLVPLCWEGQ